MTDQDVIDAIRDRHLPCEWPLEPGPDADYRVDWDDATVDPGGTVFGPGPYLHVRIEMADGSDEWVIRVYPPEPLRQHLAAAWRPSTTGGQP